MIYAENYIIIDILYNHELFVSRLVYRRVLPNNQKAGASLTHTQNIMPTISIYVHIYVYVLLFIYASRVFLSEVWREGASKEIERQKVNLLYRVTLPFSCLVDLYLIVLQ